MKSGIHPKNYRPVVFQDLSNGTNFITKSTASTDETIKVDGVEYPLVKVHISSASHPFFTGQEKLVDVEGRVDKFKARTKAAADKREASKAKAAKATARKQKASETQSSTTKVGAVKARPAPQKLGK